MVRLPNQDSFMNRQLLVSLFITVVSAFDAKNYSIYLTLLIDQ